MHNITLRPIQPEDMEFLYQLYASAREAELAQTDWTDQQKEQFLRWQFGLQHTHYQTYYPNASYDVLMLDSTPIGRQYVDRVPGEIRLMEITLLPQYRGQGIGTQLLQELLSEGRQSQSRVSLHVEQFNRAYQLYKRTGFTEVEMQGVYMYMIWTPEKTGV